MNLNDIRNILVVIAGERLQGKTFAPEQFDIMLHNAQLKHYKRKLGLPEQWQPGMPLSRQHFELNYRITMDMDIFKVHMGKVGEQPLYVNQNGYADTPLDLFYPSTMMYKYNDGQYINDRPIDLVSDQEWSDRIADELTKPTYKDPIANFQSAYIRFLPLKNTFVEFIYLRTPVSPVFGYDQSQGYIEYDSGTSTQLEWDDLNVVDIIVILLADLGLDMGKPEVIQYAEKAKSEGI